MFDNVLYGHYKTQKSSSHYRMEDIRYSRNCIMSCIFRLWRTDCSTTLAADSSARPQPQLISLLTAIYHGVKVYF